MLDSMLHRHDFRGVSPLFFSLMLMLLLPLPPLSL